MTYEEDKERVAKCATRDQFMYNFLIMDNKQEVANKKVRNMIKKH